MGNKVTFYHKNFFVSSLNEDKVIFSVERVDNVKCLMSVSHDTRTWHRRLRHVNFELLNDLCIYELVIDFPKLEISKDKPCDACQKEK